MRRMNSLLSKTFATCIALALPGAVFAAPKAPSPPADFGIFLKDLPASNVLKRTDGSALGWPQLKVSWTKSVRDWRTNVSLIAEQSDTNRALPEKESRLAEQKDVPASTTSVVLARPASLECGKKYQYYVENSDRTAFVYSPPLKLECAFHIMTMFDKVGNSTQWGGLELRTSFRATGVGVLPVGSRVVISYQVPAGVTIIAGRAANLRPGWTTDPALPDWSTPLTSTTGLAGPATVKLTYVVYALGTPGSGVGHSEQIPGFQLRVTNHPPGSACINVSLEVNGSAAPISPQFGNPRCTSN